ncbi:TetR/AcrR family transcriptional regulator [Clostridium sp.]|uniref:TetR/AcrR family transcriptional regulator n=1 Tax=Clostridium sp. TaxID=1506 RepID=UPI002FCBA5AA
MGIREEQKDIRRNEIIEVALDLFIRKGYAATKITDIAKGVGMSTGLLFHYFKSKENLYEELIKNALKGPNSIMDDKGMDPLIYFEVITKQLFRLIKERPSFSKYFVLINQAHYNESAPECVKRIINEFDIFKFTAEIIKKGQERDEIKEGNPLALGIAFWCAINGIAEQISKNPHYPCPESEWIVDIIRKIK